MDRKARNPRFRLTLAQVLLLTVTVPFALAEAAEPAAAPAAGRTASGGLTPQREVELAQKHDGYLGALAPQNLAKKRPKPPFDITGNWFINLRRSFQDYRFGPPYPEFFEPGQTALRESAEARKKGQPYREVTAQCYPAGMPMVMTRVWPINIIQLPTAVYMMIGFSNSMRFIYLDGRPHSDPDIVALTYNGESIGKWEKDALVVNTKYFEPKRHYIDSGIPISDQFEMVERITLEDSGTSLRIDYTMTDPKMWKGEWKNTKRWIRQDYSDVPESICLPDGNENLPSTIEGQKAMEDRKKAAK